MTSKAATRAAARVLCAMHRHTPTFLYATILAFLYGTLEAYAQADSGVKNYIDWTPIIVALINLVFPLIGAVATYLINKRLKDKQMAELISRAISNSLGAVRRQAIETAGKANVRIDSKFSPEINAGIQYVIDNASEAVSHFNISPDKIGEKIEAQLGLAEIATNLAATSAPGPLIAGPLAPTPHSQ